MAQAFVALGLVVGVEGGVGRVATQARPDKV
jgi:hypothetical protein